MKSAVLVCLFIMLSACDSGQKQVVSDNPTSLAISDAGGTVACSADAANHGDGWGWENGVSCRWQESDESNASAARSVVPECTEAAVNQGSGWGWENDQSCRWGDSTLGRTTPVECTSAARNQGNGWGWDNGQTCRWGNSTLSGGVQGAAASSSSGTTATTSTSSTNVSSIRVGTPSASGECSASAAVTDDGWGWEYGAPCRWGSVRPNASANSVYVPGPVRVPVPGYYQGKPICLTDASDGNSDNFGFEYGRTCAVVEGTTATAERPLLNTRWCQPWAEISYGDYVLQNNTWNDSEVYSNDWHQCIEMTGSSSRYIAKWDYNWLAKDRGNEFSVKSYPQVYYGRKTRNSVSGTPEKLGLPAPLNQLPNFKVKYKYSETGNPERNVALESFFHTSCEAEEWNKQFEMMVWVGVPVTRGPGPKVAEVTIDGEVWNVHVNPNLDWAYVAFVAQRPKQEGWLDWNKFVEWTRYNGPAYGVPRIQNNTCMGAIEIGTETFWGQGTFTLHEFKVVRN